MEELKQTDQVVLAEISAKQAELAAEIKTLGLAAVEVSRTENIAWLTAGRVDRRVLLPSDLGIARILLLANGDAYYLATENEAPRLKAEDYHGLPFRPITAPWAAPDFTPEIHALITDGRVESDTEPQCGALLRRLRSTLTGSEQERYRWLGRQTAEVTAQVLEQLAPGMTERTMTAQLASALIERGIEPSVLLIAADDRILRYRHAVAQNATLERFGMLNLCARRWGLAISITRFVHFGPMPQKLQDAFGVAAEVNARLVAATKPGATAAELYQVAADGYAACGHPGEERNHHQGGATGYSEREWIATPTGGERIALRQAFAWNPSVNGGKVEDTVLLNAVGVVETLTPTPTLPLVSTRVGGLTVDSAGVLVR